MKVKGVIQLEGYRVCLDAPNFPKKRHGFRLIHDNQRAFYFQTSTSSEMKKWVQMMIKDTIKRDFEGMINIIFDITYVYYSNLKS